MSSYEFSRRRFLLLGAAVMVAGPSACADRATDPLDDFLHLSALLTGFKTGELDAKLARTYLDTVTATLPAGLTMSELFSRARLDSETQPQTFDQLEATGVFDDARMATVLDEIAICWYSGTVPTDSPMRIRVVAYDAALAWKSITWTTPNMTCRGVTGFWSEPPASGGVA
jgi:hypothetical protein